jgi:TrmH family RNA methyltransferase
MADLPGATRDAGESVITVLLVRTHNPGNLGSAARVVTNFGATLALLDPRVELDHPDVLAYASGAERAISEATTVSSLEKASSEFDVLVALTSERGRKGRGLPARTTAAGIRRMLQKGQSVALVFGPERSGLSTEEILQCDARWFLRTEPDFPTLNLAQAVAASLALVRGERHLKGSVAEEGSLRRETWRRVLQEVRKNLEGSFPVRRTRPDVVDELVGVLRRARPTQREAELLLAALASLKTSQK